MAFAGKRRILIIVENLPVPFDRRVWQEARTLKGAGYQVCVICPKGMEFTSSYECIDGIHIYRHKLPFEADGALGYVAEYGSALFWEFLLSCRIAIKHGFDVIQGCNPPDTIFIIGLFFKLFGKKYVFDHHDVNPELYEAKFGTRGVLYKVVSLLEKLTFKTADMSIATNESYRRIAIERGGMDPQDVVVVRSGPDLARMKIAPPDQAEKHGRSTLVGYVGVMGKQEGVDLLLEAVQYIVKTKGYTDIHFTMVGRGTEFAALSAYSEELGITEHVTFIGRVPDEELLRVLNASDICVNPDRVNAMNDLSTMNKIMEYMALGKPIVQFELTEGKVSAQGASLYAEPNNIADFGDKIIALAQNPEQRAEMGHIGRERIETRLNWQHEGPKLLSFYDKLFTEHLRR